MPARIIQAVTSAAKPDELARHFVQLAGFFDDPIAQVRATIGASSGGGFTRTVRMEVVDRLAKRYPPTSFRNAKGKSPGRWLVGFYFADTEYGAPVSPSITWTTGRELYQTGSTFFTGITDPTGVIELEVTKAASTGAFWLHAGAKCLLRSSGYDWATGEATTTGTSIGTGTGKDPASPGETAGSAAGGSLAGGSGASGVVGTGGGGGTPGTGLYVGL